MRNSDKRLLLLGVLRIQKMHGYQLQQFLDQHAGSLPSLKAPTAYYTLERMAEEGLVEAQSEREGNRPVRQVYCITQLGEERFRELLAENLASYEPGDSSDDIGAAFLGELPAGRLPELLEAKRAKIQKRLAEVTAALASVETPDSVHLSLTRSRYRLEADLRWTGEILATAAANRPR